MKKIIIIPVSYCFPFFKDSASERFRCDWLLPYLPADKYNGHQKLDDYDVIIYQKAHSLEMLNLAKKYKNKKVQIYDNTDPDFIFNDLKEFVNCMDFVTTSTQATAKGFEIYGVPSYVIPDRHELSYYREIKVHRQIDNPLFVWFGYADNFVRIEPLLPILKGHKFELKAVCEQPVEYGNFVAWNKNTINKEIIEGDIVLNLPDNYGYKSNNKTTTAWCLGMPVVEKITQIFEFLECEDRVKEAEKRLKQVQEEYNIKRSAEEILYLIEQYKK